MSSQSCTLFWLWSSHAWIHCIKLDLTPALQDLTVHPRVQEELDQQYAAQRKQDWVEGNPERVFLVGVDVKRCVPTHLYPYTVQMHVQGRVQQAAACYNRGQVP